FLRQQAFLSYCKFCKCRQPNSVGPQNLWLSKGWLATLLGTLNLAVESETHWGICFNVNIRIIRLYVKMRQIRIGCKTHIPESPGFIHICQFAIFLLLHLFI